MPAIDKHTPDRAKNSMRRTYKSRKLTSPQLLELLTENNRQHDRSEHPFRKRNRLLSRKYKD